MEGRVGGGLWGSRLSERRQLDPPEKRLQRAAHQEELGEQERGTDQYCKMKQKLVDVV